ncbi:hypothetical protein IWW45_007398 [Coemansia sp. RSA 485]|nr:hypothetical protein IWW45_007398 [Coemansia sp. RSA 485]
MADLSAEYPYSDGAAYADRRHPRFMLPRASGLSTMGEIHSFAQTTAAMPPARTASDLPSYDQSSTYPATWHEYEDQFNYFYNCHFIEQDYYDYLASSHRNPGSANVSAPGADSSAGNESQDDSDDFGEDSELDQDIEDYSYSSRSPSNEDNDAEPDAGVDAHIADADSHMSDTNPQIQPSA